MKKYTVKELTEILTRNDDGPCSYSDGLRQSALNNPVAAPYLEGLKEMYKAYTENMTVALPFTKFKRYFYDGNRQDGEYWYYYNRRKLHAIALMAWLYGEKEYYDELENILWAIMDEYVWNIPAHTGERGIKELQQDDFQIDLFSAETCAAIAEILNLLGDKIEPIITKRACRLIDERMFDVFDKPIWWKVCHHNWASVCSGQVGMTAIYLKKDPAELAKIIHSCLDTMEHYISGFAEDGTCMEGLMYWAGGFGTYVHFAELLYRRTNGEVNIFDDEKVRKIAAFPRKCFFKGGKIVTFSDCGGNDSIKLNLSLQAKLCEFVPGLTLPEEKFCELNYPRGSCPSFAGTFRSLIWAPDSLDSVEMKPETYVLPNAQWFISSSDNGVGIAAKAGYNWEGVETHNHNDAGSFLIYKNGQNLVSDLGGGVYSASYFDHRFRYGNLACSSRGHSVPIIEGEEQRYGEKYRTKNTVITEDGGITSDIAGAYESENLESLVRNVRLDKSAGRVSVTDSYKFKAKPKSVIERFVSINEPRLENGEVTVSAGGETLTFGYDKNAVKPILSVVVDTEKKIRQSGDFKVYMIDFEVIEPSEEFTLEFTME